MTNGHQQHWRPANKLKEQPEQPLYSSKCSPIGLLVRQSEPPAGNGWRYLRATFWACVGERTYHPAVSHSKLLATVPGRCAPGMHTPAGLIRFFWVCSLLCPAAALRSSRAGFAMTPRPCSSAAHMFGRAPFSSGRDAGRWLALFRSVVSAFLDGL